MALAPAGDPARHRIRWTYGFAVAHDDGLPAIAARLSPDLARDTRVMKHMRVATAAFSGTFGPTVTTKITPPSTLVNGASAGNLPASG